MLRLVILRLLESYFRHRWLYFLPVVIMSIAGGLYFVLAIPVYSAEGVFFVQDESILTSITSLRDSGYSWETPAQSTMGELSELLQTDAFVRAVIEKTDLEENMDEGREQVERTFSRVRESLRLSVLGDNQIRIAVEHRDPVVAQQLANGIFDTYLQWKINADRNEGQVATEFLIGLVNEYKNELDVSRQILNDYLLAHPQPLRGDRPDTEELEISRLQSDIVFAEERYSNALDKDEDARLALAQAENAIRQTYFLVDAPTVPDKPGTSLKDAVVNMAIFIILGFILSGVGIVGGALLDRTFLFPIDVEYGLGIPVLTELKDMTPKRRWWKRKTKEADPLTQNQRIEVDSAEPTATGNAANLVGSHENEVVEAKNEEKEVELT